MTKDDQNLHISLFLASSLEAESLRASDPFFDPALFPIFPVFPVALWQNMGAKLNANRKYEELAKVVNH